MEETTKKPTILVTGATGVAGSQVIREFVRNKYPVRALVRKLAKAVSLRAFPNVGIAEGDMLQPETLMQAFLGVEHALLLSSPNQQLVKTQNTFIDAAKKAGIKHIVKFSGLSAADIDSPFVFAGRHKEIETHLEHSGLSWTHLRPSQFMTEYLREVPAILAHSSLFLPFKDARLVPVDVVDIAKAAFILLTSAGHEGKIYEMSGPEALNIEQVAEQISNAISWHVGYVSISLEERKQALLSAGIPSFLVDALDIQSRERLKGTESILHPETHNVLGISPTSFAQFACRNAGAFLGESVYVGMN